MNAVEALISEKELCDWLGLSEPTLYRHRREGTGPKFVRLSQRRVAYRRSAVEAWLLEREQSRIIRSDASPPQILQKVPNITDRRSADPHL
jgi:predicted DNA-binding transcriptional regulator AlpA